MTDQNPPELYRPEPGEVVNPAQAAISTEIASPGELLKKDTEEKFDSAKQTAKTSVENFVISRRDFLKVSGKVGLGLLILGGTGYAYIKRHGIFAFIENIASKFTIEKEKPIDPRIVSAFGEDYPAWASGQAEGQYGMYLTDNQDNSFNITNIPQPGDKNNVVWLLTYEKGITWPFVTPERDGNLRDPNLYPLPTQEQFISRIVSALGLNDQQKADLSQRWPLLSQDPHEVLSWLKDLKTQGVTSITDNVIKFYEDPVTYMTGVNR